MALRTALMELQQLIQLELERDSVVHHLDEESPILPPLLRQALTKTASLGCEGTPLQALGTGLLSDILGIALQHTPMKQWPHIRLVSLFWCETVLALLVRRKPDMPQHHPYITLLPEAAGLLRMACDGFPPHECPTPPPSNANGTVHIFSHAFRPSQSLRPGVTRRCPSIDYFEVVWTMGANDVCGIGLVSSTDYMKNRGSPSSIGWTSHSGMGGGWACGIHSDDGNPRVNDNNWRGACHDFMWTTDTTVG